ncbi:hypothetical protein LZ017_18220 [Pelomonas sp. CA6]|uniref:hypothetical protein n=1 Tax=Pelomonas sp. CA6 TaxID=2907999 RepID=UPI001F4BD102|nr:hypothetical protein [Pelomonas sp. CA6]MCH7345321.1 hypothetical protein [Pelomonas sp. CA6]
MPPEPAPSPASAGVVLSPLPPWLRDVVLHALHESGTPLMATPHSCLAAMQQAETVRAGLLVAPLAALSPTQTGCLLQAPPGLRMLVLSLERQGIAAYELRLLTRDLSLAELTRLLRGGGRPEALPPAH